MIAELNIARSGVETRGRFAELTVHHVEIIY